MAFLQNSQPDLCLLAKSGGCSVYQLRNESGEGTMTVYEAVSYTHLLSGFLAGSEEGEKTVYHSGDRRAPRLQVQRLDEGLRSAGAPAPVAVFDVSHPGGSPGRAGAAHRYILVSGKKTRCAA